MFLESFTILFKIPKLSKLFVLRKLYILISIKLSCLALSLYQTFAQTTQFPYKAQIIKPNAYVRSGPGLEYYPTDILPAGQMVEVYRHDPGGWCAIRPPEGSFSWVLAQQVEMAPDGLGRAKQDQVPVVVGSRLKNLQDIVQVYLKQGEAVELVEEDHPDHQKEKKIWYKIAPPSGEFRWIFSQDISPLNGASASACQTASGGQRSCSASAPMGLVEEGQNPSVGAGLQGVSQSLEDSQGGSARPAGQRSPCPSEGGLQGAWASFASGNSGANSQPATSPTAIAIPSSSGGIGLSDFHKQLQQIELDLGSRILHDPHRWQLEDLYIKTESLLGHAPDASSRSEARQLLARIGRFIEVQRRYAQILLAGRLQSPKPSASSAGGVGPPNVYINESIPQSNMIPGSPRREAPANSEEAASPAGRPSIMGRPPQAADRFDAMGRLTRVVSAKPGAPTYALLDERGEVVCYLTPAPGVNLHPLEGKWIAVTGVIGLMLEPRAKHVAVKQVALVDPPAKALR